MSRIISPASYVTVDLAAACIGLTDRAIRRKIQDGVWLDGREYRKGPDGRVYIHLEDGLRKCPSVPLIAKTPP